MNTETALVVSDSNLPSKQPAGLFGASEPADVVAKATQVAQALKDVIRRQGLISSIQGKEYPRCEAWTLLGTMLGVFPVLVWTKQVDGGWEARVEAKTRDGSVVGAAEAQCLRGERNWTNRDDFALRSMAQTRATAKCLRMPLGFVMTLAGYEPTPAEEMVIEQPQKPAQTKPATDPKPVYATDATRKWMIGKLSGCPAEATEYFRKAGMLLDTENLEDLPLRFVPVSNEQLVLLCKAIGRFPSGDPAEPAFPPNPEKPEKSAKTIEVPRDKQVDATQDDPNHPEAAWRTFPMPWGKEAGVPLAELDKKYLYGLWVNYVVETEYNGKPKSADNIAKDRRFRSMLDSAGQHYEFTKKD